VSHSPGFPNPIDLLPHRDPFLLVTRIVDLTPGANATCEWVLTGDEVFWPGHFPGRPTMPGVLMIESLAQTGAIALMADERFATKLALFGGVDGVRFRRQVVPGETLLLEVTLGQMSSRMGKGHGRASVDGKTACEADLLFVLADR
jgi:3-hydroxyacyl-[acyl-carrier-protein] dehydratase